MEADFRKVVKITLLCVSMPEEDYNHTEYLFGNECREFDDSFSLGAGTLQEALFGVVIIVLFRRLKNNKRVVGVIKVRLKQLIYNLGKCKNNTTDKSLYNYTDKCINNTSNNSINNSLNNESINEIVVKILPAKYFKTADFYKQEEHAIGEALLSFETKPFPNSLMLVQPPTLPRNILDFFQLEDKMRIYKIIFELFSETQKGTVLCRIHWILGLLSAEYYYSLLYKSCPEGHCDPVRCQERFCENTYRNIPAELLKEGVQILQYAAASFANSIILWRLKKPQTMPHISDPRLRSILERLGIKPENLYKDKHGMKDRLAFIAFFVEDKMVISFKGTTNGSEAVHDLNCEYVTFQDGYAHNGILRLAKKFIEEDWPDLHGEMKRRGVGRVLFTGHSLGAAASILVYLILQEHGYEESLDIEVVGFSSPPVVSKSIAARKLPRIRVFIYGSDIISRLNFGSVLDLKYICISISSLYDYFTDKERVVKKVREIKKYLSENELYTKLYHPGTLYHIKRFECGKKTVHLYKKVEPDFFEDLISIRQAPFDHFIHNLYRAFSQNEE